MSLKKDLSPCPTELIDWINGEGFLDLDWDFPEDGDLYEAGLDDSILVELTAAIEGEYEIEMNPSEFKKAKIKTPCQLAALIGKKQQ